jgi:hypothetical protein
MRKCRSGKPGFVTYGEAIKHLDRVLRQYDGGGLLQPGSVYWCPSCGLMHATRNTAVVKKRRGRGKRKSKAVR